MMDARLSEFTELCIALTRPPAEDQAPDLGSFGLAFGLGERNQAIFATRVADYYAVYFDELGNEALTPEEHAAAVAQNALSQVMTNHRPSYPYFARTWLFASTDAVFTHSLYEDEEPARAQCEVYASGTMTDKGQEQIMQSVFGDNMTCQRQDFSERTAIRRCNWPGYARNVWVEITQNDGRQMNNGHVVSPNVRLTMMYQTRPHS